MTLQQLQDDYKAGKITKAQYDAAVAELLEDGDLTQEEHDAALSYDPEDDGGEDDKPIYTQGDMDRVVVKKARQLLRKQLNDAGVVLDGVNNKELLTHIVGLVQTGANAGKDETELQQQLTAAQAKAAKLDKLTSQLEASTVENAVLKSAGKYSPVNPAQVIRALNADYKDLLEYDDETGVLLPQSVDRALKRIATAEPNLFQTPEGGEEHQQQGFAGKPPGGAAGGATGKQTALEAQKAKALEMMGFGTKTN